MSRPLPQQVASPSESIQESRSDFAFLRLKLEQNIQELGNNETASYLRLWLNQWNQERRNENAALEKEMEKMEEKMEKEIGALSEEASKWHEESMKAARQGETDRL